MQIPWLLILQRSHIYCETIFHVAINFATEGRVDDFHIYHSDIAYDSKLTTKSKYFLGVLNATNERSCDTLSAHLAKQRNSPLGQSALDRFEACLRNSMVVLY